MAPDDQNDDRDGAKPRYETRRQAALRCRGDVVGEGSSPGRRLRRRRRAAAKRAWESIRRGEDLGIGGVEEDEGDSSTDSTYESVGGGSGDDDSELEAELAEALREELEALRVEAESEPRRPQGSMALRPRPPRHRPRYLEGLFDDEEDEEDEDDEDDEEDEDDDEDRRDGEARETGKHRQRRRDREGWERRRKNDDDEDDDEDEDEEDEEADGRGRKGVRMPREERRYLMRQGEGVRARYLDLERRVREADASEKPWRFRLLDSAMPLASKALALRRLEELRRCDQGSSEHLKLAAWFGSLLSVPFGRYSAPMASPSDGLEATTAALLRARELLDSSAFGHEKAKAELLGVVANCISRPDGAPPYLALQGSPGTGKTTLLRNGVAKALGRPFVQISLGGAQDAALLCGHGFTYEGSCCGAVARALIDSRVMDPVILFDELDKVSTTRSGEEVTNLLVHLCDTSQNTEFSDRYFGQVPLDLSRALLCFSFNDEAAVSPVLLNRLRVVRCPDHSVDDKREILRRFVLPEALRTAGLTPDDVRVEPDAEDYLISLSAGEPGVRSLKRHVGAATTKINVRRLCEADRVSSLGPSFNDTPASLPLRIDARTAEALVPRSEALDPEHPDRAPHSMFL